MLVGNRVVLRPFRRTDLDGLYDLVADVREIGEFWPLGCISEPRWLKQFDETSWWSDEFKLFLITDRDGRRIGQVNIYKASHSYDGWELGYRIYRPEDRGKGYATEAVCLATAYLSRVLSRRQGSPTLPAGVRRRRPCWSERSPRPSP